MAFHNRLRDRGAIVASLLMINRFERDLAKEKGVLTMLMRAASTFRQQDIRERGGRPSWRSLDDLLRDHPWLRAIRGRV